MDSKAADFIVQRCLRFLLKLSNLKELNVLIQISSDDYTGIKSRCKRSVMLEATPAVLVDSAMSSNSRSSELESWLFCTIIIMPT